MKSKKIKVVAVLGIIVAINLSFSSQNVHAEVVAADIEKIASPESKPTDVADQASDAGKNITETSDEVIGKKVETNEAIEDKPTSITESSAESNEQTEDKAKDTMDDAVHADSEVNTDKANVKMPRQDNKFFTQSLVVTTNYGAKITDDTTVPSNTDLVYRFHYEHIPGTPAQKLKFDFRQKGFALKSYMISMPGMPKVMRKASGEHTSYEFYQTLDDKHNQIDIEVHGYVQRVQRRIKIPAGSASMSWNTGFLLPNWHYREGPTLPRFTILPIGDIHMKVKATTINTLPHEPVNIEGVLAHDDSLKCDDVVVQLRRSDGSNVMTTQDKDDQFKITLQPRDLELGSNQLTLHAHCKGVYGSFPIEINVEVEDGELKLSEVSKNVSFANTTLNGEAKEVQRQGEMQVEVEDTRHDLKEWRVTVANPDGLKDEHGDSLKGKMIYKQAGNLQTIAETPVVVATHKMEKSADEKYDVSENWQNDSGILLEVAPDAAAGKYQGTLTWTLSDAPNGQ